MSGYTWGVVASAGAILIGLVAFGIVASRNGSQAMTRAVGLWLAAGSLAFWTCVVLALVEVVS